VGMRGCVGVAVGVWGCICVFVLKIVLD